MQPLSEDQNCTGRGITRLRGANWRKRTEKAGNARWVLRVQHAWIHEVRSRKPRAVGRGAARKKEVSIEKKSRTGSGLGGGPCALRDFAGSRLRTEPDFRATGPFLPVRNVPMLNPETPSAVVFTGRSICTCWELTLGGSCRWPPVRFGVLLKTNLSSCLWGLSGKPCVSSREDLCLSGRRTHKTARDRSEFAPTVTGFNEVWQQAGTTEECMPHRRSQQQRRGGYPPRLWRFAHGTFSRLKNRQGEEVCARFRKVDVSPTRWCWGE